MKKLFVLVLFFFTFFATAPFAAASPKQALQITPIITDISLTPQKQYSYPVTITNLADIPVGIHIDVSNFDVAGKAEDMSIPSSPLYKWITLSDTDIIFAPREKRTIIVTINPPAHVPNGGYYATFTYTPYLNQEFLPNSPVVLSRIVGIVFATVGNPDFEKLAKQVAITNFSPSSFVTISNTPSFTFAVKNSYITHFVAKPFLTLTPLFGSPKTYLVEEKHILPSTTRGWTYTIPDNLSPMAYRAHLAISIGNGKQLTKETYVLIIPTNILLGFLCLSILLFMFVIRKRLHKALLIFIQR